MLRLIALSIALFFSATRLDAARLGATVDPEKKEDYYRRAVEYLERFQRDDVGQAVRLFGAVVHMDASDPRGHAGLAEARALRYLWGWDPSEEALGKGVGSGEHSVELGPEVGASHLALGLARVAEERYTPALSELDQASALSPASFRAHLYRGMVLRGLRRTDEALEESSAALKLNASSPMGHALKGDCLQDQRRFAEARQAYLRALELDQRLLWPRLGLAASYQREMNFGAAEKTYLITEKDFPEDQDRIRILGAALMVATERYDDAIALYQAISDKAPVSPPLYRRLMQAGRAYSLDKLGRTEEAEYFWSLLVEEFPDDFDGGFRDRDVVSQGDAALARIYESKGEVKRAEQVLEKACARPGMKFSLYADLSRRQAAQGKADEAIATLERGLTGAPPDEDWVTATQDLLPAFRGLSSNSLSSKTRTNAERFLDNLSTRVLAHPSTSTVPLVNLARGEALVGRSSRAMEYLRQAADRGYSGLKGLGKDPDFRGVATDPAFKELAKPR